MSRAALSGALMVCGTASDAGKTTVVTGLCRLLARRRISVAPFKAQNMALNSAVTASGHEIGRAQAAQAQAACVEAEVAMNPILLKPTSDRTSQVVIMGKPWATLNAAEYHAAKPELLGLVAGQLASLRERFDVVVCEGAGSPVEINLLDGDLVNLRLAEVAGMKAILVGDIDRGGVFASLFGTVMLLPDGWRQLVRGFVINKFRGDPALLGSGPAELERRTGIPSLGVLPWLDGLLLDAEDSLSLPGLGRGDAACRRAASLDVAVVRFPRIANFTDLDPLAAEPAVSLRLVDNAAALGRPDLVVLPGSKATVSDLGWLRSTGLADAVLEWTASGTTTVLGVCGGYQMLGTIIEDDVESAPPASVSGLGLLPVRTTFVSSKVTRRRSGRSLGEPVHGYEIHHGRTPPSQPWLELDGEPEGASAADGSILGTSLHGVFESDPFRHAFLRMVADHARKPWDGSTVSFAARRESRFDRLADALEAHLDIDAIEETIAAAGAPGGAVARAVPR